MTKRKVRRVRAWAVFHINRVMEVGPEKSMANRYNYLVDAWTRLSTDQFNPDDLHLEEVEITILPKGVK